MWPTVDLSALRGSAFGFAEPAYLWWGGLLMLGLLLLVARRGPTRVSVPTLGARGRRLDPSWGLSLGLRFAALALALLALARPAGQVPENPAGGSGVDLLVAIDASGSMNALDVVLDGRRVTRLDLAKRVVGDFIRQRDHDRIGLVVFGEHAFTQSPLSVDHRLVQSALARVQVGVAGDATALGEAIGLGVRRLRVSGAPPDAQRVLLLITDGRHNAGRLGPETAARIARTDGVRIHAIGIGGQGKVPFAQDHPGEPLRFEEVNLDRATLQKVADLTQGRFFHARHPEDRGTIAAAIDTLEVHEQRPEPRLRRASLAPLALASALILLLFEAATAHGLLRRLP